MATIQIVNQHTRSILEIRLKRDELLKKLYITRQSLYRTSIILDSEYIKISNARINFNLRTNEICELYKASRCNSINISIENRKTTEMKLNIINEIIQLDINNLTIDFNMQREIKINDLTNNMNSNYPMNHDENLETFASKSIDIENKIQLKENELISIENECKIMQDTIINMAETKQKLHQEAEDIIKEILPLNEIILEDPERHDVYNTTFVNNNE